MLSKHLIFCDLVFEAGQLVFDHEIQWRTHFHLVWRRGLLSPSITCLESPFVLLMSLLFLLLLEPSDFICSLFCLIPLVLMLVGHAVLIQSTLLWYWLTSHLLSSLSLIRFLRHMTSVTRTASTNIDLVWEDILRNKSTSVETKG